jgi:hypothetical protein
MTDLSQPARSFDLTPSSETVETECFGTVTISDIGADGIERIAAHMRDAGQADDREMARRLLCESATGSNGERFTPEGLAHMPARAFRDRIKLLTAAMRVNGLSQVDVEKA